MGENPSTATESFHINEESRESIRHEFWKNFYVRRFVDRGYSVAREAPRRGGRVDVLAVKDDEKIGIEIETGKSDVVKNVRNCLRSGFSKVIVVATDRGALKKVERQLAKEGLLVPSRVRVECSG